MSPLRRAVVRLAAENPVLRSKLLALVQTRTAAQHRVYEYSDRDGNTFWSFSLMPDNAMLKMRLSDHQGTHFRTHITHVQSLALQRFEDW